MKEMFDIGLLCEYNVSTFIRVSIVVALNHE